MKMFLLLLLAGCTGAPDSVTLYGGRGTAAYNNAAGQPAFDEVGYSYGVAVTYQIPSTRTHLQDEEMREMVESLGRVEAELREARSNPQPVVIQTPPAPATAEEKPPPEDEMTVKMKGAITLVIIAVAGVLAAVLKGMVKRVGKNRQTSMKNQERIEQLERSKKMGNKEGV